MRHAISVIVLLTLVAPFASSEWSVLQVAGGLSLYVSLVLLFCVAFSLLLKNGGFSKDGVFPLFFLIASLILIILPFDINGDVISKIGQFFFISLCIFIGNNLSLQYDDIREIVKRGALFSSILLFFLAVSGCLLGWEYAGGLGNSNTLGMVAVGMLAWALMKEGGGKNIFFYRIAVLCSGFYVVIISMSRTAILSSIALILMRYFSFCIFKNKLLYWFSSCFFLLLPLMVVFLYVGPFSDFFNNIYMEYFSEFSDKRFESGRDVIWSLIFENGKLSPFFGFGLSARPGIFLDMEYEENLSAHNLYLQIFLQSGAIGFFAWFVLFVYIFIEIWRRRKNFYGKGLFCFFVSILLVQCFEVSLTQNNFNAVSNFWALLMCVFAINCRNNLSGKNYFQN